MDNLISLFTITWLFTPLYHWIFSRSIHTKLKQYRFFPQQTPNSLSYVKFWHLLRLMNNNKIDKKEQKYTYKRISMRYFKQRPIAWCLRVTMRWLCATLCNVMTLVYSIHLSTLTVRLFCITTAVYIGRFVVRFLFLIYLCADHQFNTKRVRNHAYELTNVICALYIAFVRIYQRNEFLSLM